MTRARRVTTLESGSSSEAEGTTESSPPTRVDAEVVIAELIARRETEDAQKATWLRRLVGAREAEIVRVLHEIDGAVEAERARLETPPSDAPRRRVWAVERTLFEAYGHVIAETIRCAAIAALFAAGERSISRNETFNLVRRTETDQSPGADLADALVVAAQSYVKRNFG